MNRKKKIFGAIALVLFMQAPTLWGSEAAKWASIARSLSSSNYGVAYNYPDEWDAKQTAFEACQLHAYKERDCVVFYTSNKAGYYAYADGENLKGAVAFATESKESAIEAAMKKCSEISTNCGWRYWWSNSVVVTDQ